MRKISTFSHYKMNFQLGMFSFMSHRITGVLLLISGVIMLTGFSVVMLGRTTFEELIILLQFPVFRVFAHIISISLFWHVLNGIKILIIDLFRAGRIHKALTLIMIVIFILGIIFYFIYGYPKLVHA